MKRLRVLLVIFAIAVFAVYGVYLVRDKMTSDYVAPVITADADSILASVQASDQELMSGLSATDNLDGDVTGSLVLVSKSKFVQDGTRYVNYAAFDNNKNVGTYTRTLTYTDYVSPRFSVSQPLRFLSGSSNQDYLRNITAHDCLDGDITKQIMITYGAHGAISDTIMGQTVNLQVTNSAGDTETLELVFTEEDYNSFYQQSPSLSEYLVYVHPGEKPDYRALLNGIWSGNNTRSFSDSEFNLYEDVWIDDSRVDYYTAGVYQVTYTLSRLRGDEVRETLGTAVLNVVVEA